MAHVLTLSGSPSAPSRTTALLHHVGRRLRAHGHDVRHLAVRDLPPGPLLTADHSHPAIAGAVAAVDRAAAVVLGTPIHQAAYSGLLKTLLDLLPPHALAGRTVLPLATGGSTAHALAVDYALRPVLTALGTDHVLRGRFVLDRHLVRTDTGGLDLDPHAAPGVADAVQRLLTALDAAPATALAAAPRRTGEATAPAAAPRRTGAAVPPSPTGDGPPAADGDRALVGR